MTTSKPKILLTVDKELLNRIDDFRFENRIFSRSEAIRQLIWGGLKYFTGGIIGYETKAVEQIKSQEYNRDGRLKRKVRYVGTENQSDSEVKTK